MFLNDRNTSGKTRPRTQSERSSRTRRLVCEATLDALVELGGDKVSTNLVAKRAKISRGALTHQFPTRIDMYVAAYHYIIEGYYEGYPFNTGPDFIRLDISEFIDALWELIYEHKWYAAAVELMLQSSRDHELGLRLRDILARWTSFRDASAMKILGIDPLDRDAIELFQMTLSLMRGTALLHTLSADPASIQMHLNRWKSIAKSTMLGGPEIQRFTVNNPQTSSS